jgi:hypothetical protein
MSAANCDALCASAVLIFIVTVALPRPNERVILERIVEYSELAKGVGVMVREARQALVAGSLQALVDLESWDVPTPLPEELTRPLQDIKQLVISSSSSSSPDDDDSEDIMRRKKSIIYLQAIDTLEKTLAAVLHNASHPTVIFIFLTLVDRQFIHLVASGDLTALRILGHYGVCASYVPNKWWMKAYGPDIVRACKAYIEWATRGHDRGTGPSSFSQELLPIETVQVD